MAGSSILESSVAGVDGVRLSTPPVLTGVSLFSMSSNFFGLMTRPERVVFSLSAGVLALTGVLGVFAIGVGANLACF